MTMFYSLNLHAGLFKMRQHASSTYAMTFLLSALGIGMDFVYEHPCSH